MIFDPTMSKKKKKKKKPFMLDEEGDAQTEETQPSETKEVEPEPTEDKDVEADEEDSRKKGKWWTWESQYCSERPRSLPLVFWILCTRWPSQPERLLQWGWGHEQSGHMGPCQISFRLVSGKIPPNPQDKDDKTLSLQGWFSNLACPEVSSSFFFPVPLPVLTVVVFECRQKEIGPR